MRAYVLGHLCHIAGDVISHPFINDIEWHEGIETREKFTHAGGEGSLDAMVARSVFMRDGPRGGKSWGKWWPELGSGRDRVPEEFFAAYEQALENIYKARSRRPHGFFEFERKLSNLEPPGLDASFIKDGYSLYRSGIINVGYGYGFGKWFLVLGILFAPAIFMPLLMHLLPRGKQLFVEPDDPADEGCGAQVVRGFVAAAVRRHPGRSDLRSVDRLPHDQGREEAFDRRHCHLGPGDAGGDRLHHRGARARHAERGALASFACRSRSPWSS